jgi:hypothetical protein
METKSKTVVPWLLGHNVTKDNLFLRGSRLPTNLDVLKCMYAYIKLECAGKQTSVLQEAAEYVYDQVLPFYHKADIHIKETQNCINYIKVLYNDAKDISKLQKGRRSTSEKYQKHNVWLTSQLWHHNAEYFITNEEDKAFLNSMKTDRNASWSGADILSRGKAEEER